MVTLNKRQKEIISFLGYKEEYVTIDSIAKIFDVSSRTVRNDLDSIEDFLKNYFISLERKPRIGIKIILKDNQYIESILKTEQQNTYSSEERIIMILLVLIIRGKATIEELADEVGVSKNTLIHDLKYVVTKLEENNIKVSKKVYYGITLEGEEEKIRNTFLRIYSRLNESLKNDIKQRLVKETKVDFSIIKKMIQDIEKSIGIVYSEDSIEELEIITFLTICRSNKNLKSKINSNILENRKEFKILKEVTRIDDSEINYLLNLVDGLSRSSNGEEANIIAQKLLKDLCNVLNIDCSKDLDFTSQIAIHLKVAIHRIKNNLVIKNPMLEEIKYKMPFIYRITQKILFENKDFIGVEFPEDEIAYIAMYFDAIFERNVKSNFKYRILLVCNGGLATSSLLKARINTYIPEVDIVNICRVRDVEGILKNSNIDFIISTVPLEIKDYKVIKVNPLLDNVDTERIKNEIYNKRYEKNCKYLINAVKKEDEVNLVSLFPEEFTQLDLDIDDWRLAIEVAAEPLVRANKIKSDYVKEIIKVIEVLGNYMVFVPGIAFVHATPEFVMENSMSLLTLKSEINFGRKKQVQVKTIVVIANKTENMNLVNLINVITKPENIDRFKNLKFYKDIIDLS